MKLNDLTGKRFGRLTVLERVDNKGRHTAWLCRCDCGVEKEVISGNLNRGLTTSCGCYAREKIVDHGKQINLRHGKNHKGRPSLEYRSWCAMKQRCLNKNARAYANYGGKGVNICPNWAYDFPAFLADMGPRPSKEYTLDRIDPEKGYYPGNCRWADKNTQSRNQKVRAGSKTGVTGVRQQGSRFVASISNVYLGCFTSVDDAIKARKNAEKKYWGDSNG